LTIASIYALHVDIITLDTRP